MNESELEKSFSAENSVVWGTFNKKLFVLWDCPAGHSYPQSINGRVKGYRCSYCSGKRILPGFNDLGTTHPSLVKEWHPTKNGISFTEISKGSVKKVWWLGAECNHSWLMSPNSRVHGQGCAVCSGSQIDMSSSLVATHAEILDSWSKNNTISPDAVSYGSKKKVLWNCEYHGEYLATIQSRAKGHGCYYCGKKATGSAKSLPVPGASVENIYPELVLLWDNKKNDTSLASLKPGSNKIVHWKCPKGHEYTSSVYTQVKALNSPTLGCGQCWQSSSTSASERELQVFVQNLIPQGKQELVFNNRSTIYPQELDIFVPEKKIAVEFNGLYWHSEQQGKGKWYHHSKWLACKEKGIQLIQIWEDDWNRNPGLVKELISHKLGVSNKEKVYARNTEIVILDKDTANKFLTENHIQGSVDGYTRLGLRSEHFGLVAVMVLKREPGSEGEIFNLLRFATSCVVPGGFSKLLAFVGRSNPKVKQIITFSDNAVSDGGLYQTHGFVAEKILPPDYSYVVGKERKHKFGYRLKRFRNDPELQYVEGLTEKELALLNNIPWVWDSGKTRWVKTL